MNSPENPTGKVYSREEIDALAKVSEHKNIWLVSDEVMHRIVYHSKWHPPLGKKVIVINSFEVLLVQYEQIWEEIRHLDSSYIQITLIYTALIGAYIGIYQTIIGNAVSISIGLAMVCVCIIGALYRIRSLIDELLSTAAQIEDLTLMIKGSGPTRLGSIRTSTYLAAIVVILSVLAIALTLMK